MKYGGGDKGEAETLRAGSQGVFQAQLELAKQTNEQAQASGKNIQQGLSILAAQKTREEAMAHETQMQQEHIAGQAKLQEQEGQIKGGLMEKQAGIETQQRGQAAELKGEATFDQQSGQYVQSPLSKQEQIGKFNLANAQRAEIMARVTNQKRITDVHLEQMQLETGAKREDLERKAEDSMSKAIEHLYSIESGAAEHLSLIDVADKAHPQKMQALQRVQAEARAQRGAMGLSYAAKTGDTAFMIPDSEEHKQFVNLWTPIARTTLNSSPAMKEIARRKGADYASKMVNRFAAQLMVWGTTDPSLMQAASQAFLQQGGGGGGAPGAPGAGGQQGR